MADEAALEDKRTAIALIRCQLSDDKAGWFSLVRGTENFHGVVAALSSTAAVLADVLGQLTGVRAEEALQRLATNLGMEEPDEE